MISFIEEGVRCLIEISNITYAKSNNTRLGTQKDEAEQETELPFVDYSSMYPTAYSSFLPVGGYQWITENEIQTLDLNNVPDEQGYLLSVDISTPDSMDELNCLPLAPCKRTINMTD
jgi:hypothetical protein